MIIEGKLKTSQDKHAIQEVVLSFTVTPQIVDPKGFEGLLKEGGNLHTRYQKYESITLRRIELGTRLNETVVNTVNNPGFRMISFKDGRTSKVIQGLNRQRQAIFTFNVTDYVGWESFRTGVIQDAKAIATYADTYFLGAMSLMYIDEFIFENKGDYNSRMVFNIDDSRSLPKGIEDSDYVDLNYDLVRHKEGKSYHDNVSIKVSDKGTEKNIRIAENISLNIPNAGLLVDFLNSNVLSEHLNFMHKENKSTLKDILASNVLKAIGLCK